MLYKIFKVFNFVRKGCQQKILTMKLSLRYMCIYYMVWYVHVHHNAIVHWHVKQDCVQCTCMFLLEV